MCDKKKTSLRKIYNQSLNTLDIKQLLVVLLWCRSFGCFVNQRCRIWGVTRPFGGIVSKGLVSRKGPSEMRYPGLSVARLLCLWVKRTGTEAPDLVKSFLSGIGKQSFEWGGAFGHKFCFASVFVLAGSLVIWSLVNPEETKIWFRLVRGRKDPKYRMKVRSYLVICAGFGTEPRKSFSCGTFFGFTGYLIHREGTGVRCSNRSGWEAATNGAFHSALKSGCFLNGFARSTGTLLDLLPCNSSTDNVGAPPSLLTHQIPHIEPSEGPWGQYTDIHLVLFVPFLVLQNSSLVRWARERSDRMGQTSG